MRGVPAYAQRNPELGFWHAVGLLVKEGLVAPFKLSEMPIELYMFYLFELESQANLEKEQSRDAANKLRDAANKARRPR